jgi:signal transduction histidine kinase
MMDQMLDISRIALGHFTLDLAQVDLCNLARRVVDQVQLTLERHSVVLHCELELVVVVGDELRLEQVMQNLVHNAIKYSPNGGLVTVTLLHQEHRAAIVVQDQGIGIPAAAQSRLFERFYRAGNVDGLPIAGMGIGLYVVQEIVRRHGGEVKVTSREGEGSTFTVLLPLTVPPHGPLPYPMS